MRTFYRAPKLVIWDYDGTLAPTREQIVPSFRAAFFYALGVDLSDEEILSWFGPTDEAVIRHHVPQDRYQDAQRIFYETYRGLEAKATLYPGLREFIDRTRPQVRHALVTNKGRMTTEIALRGQNLRQLLAMVITGDDVTEPKPHPMGIQRILRKLEIGAQEAVFIGDSPTDIEAAHRAGVAAIAVAYGGIHSADVLAEHSPSLLIENPAQIARWFDALS